MANRSQIDLEQTSSQARIGVEPFDVGYGAGYEAAVESPQDLECELVEDDGDFRAHRPEAVDRPRRLAFVDGTMRTDARLTRTDEAGVTVAGLAGSWAAGTVLSVDGSLSIERVQIGRATFFGAGQTVRLPARTNGWRWDAYAEERDDVESLRRRLQRCMREAEGLIADQLSGEGWLAVVDGPLHSIRRSRGVPVIGYVKTHHRRMLANECWTRVPQLLVGERSGLFAIGDDVYGCYLRIGDAGPWAGPWAGIVRVEVPAGAGREEAIMVAERASAWLPRYASAPHRDPRGSGEPDANRRFGAPSPPSPGKSAFSASGRARSGPRVERT